jgi:uncharacterized protein
MPDVRDAEQAGSEQAGSEQAGSEQAGSEQTGSAPTGSVRPAQPVAPTDAASAPVPPEAAAPVPVPVPPVVAAPSDSGWLRVSPKYIVVEVVGSLISMVIFVGAFAAVYLLWGQWWALWAAIVIGVVSLVSIAFEPRRVRSIGYRLRADDLLFRRGIMFQRQVAVPYGRMQLVDITRGPVARALGLADLKFVTAAASTAVTVPGLPMEEADRLRDQLVALAETRRAGL